MDLSGEDLKMLIVAIYIRIQSSMIISKVFNSYPCYLKLVVDVFYYSILLVFLWECAQLKEKFVTYYKVHKYRSYFVKKLVLTVINVKFVRFAIILKYSEKFKVFTVAEGISFSFFK